MTLFKTDHGPTTLRCEAFGHKYDQQVAIGRLMEVCSRCNRSRGVHDD